MGGRWKDSIWFEENAPISRLELRRDLSQGFQIISLGRPHPRGGLSPKPDLGLPSPPFSHLSSPSHISPPLPTSLLPSPHFSSLLTSLLSIPISLLPIPTSPLPFPHLSSPSQISPPFPQPPVFTHSTSIPTPFLHPSSIRLSHVSLLPSLLLYPSPHPILYNIYSTFLLAYFLLSHLPFLFYSSHNQNALLTSHRFLFLK